MTELRVVPGQTNVTNVTKHIARYNFALPYVTGKNVMDAACGSGYGSFLLSTVAKEVFAVDVDPSAYDPRFEAENIHLGELDLNLPWPNTDSESLDAVVSFETLEHLENPEILSREVAKYLKTGGLFIFSVPLYEKPGQNEFHKQTYGLGSARLICSQLQTEFEFVQRGVNFYMPNSIEAAPMSYYFCIKRKM